MKFYAIVLTGKDVSTLDHRVFESVAAAQEIIRLECLDETYVKVTIIELGRETTC